MDLPEENIRATKITAEDLNIELKPQQHDSTGGLLASGTTPKLKIYNQSTLAQKIQYWLLVSL